MVNLSSRTPAVTLNLDYLDLLVALREGRVLVCERMLHDRIVDRWLTHRDYNDELKYVLEDERLIFRRAMAVQR